MRPLIALLAEINDERYSGVQQAYVHAIEASGGTPMLIPYLDEIQSLEKAVAACDGFLFTGGADIAPSRYGEAAKEYCGEIRHWRDELEFRVFELAFKTNKPILAICRGLQLINVALGGTLYQDIPSEIGSAIIHRQKTQGQDYAHSVAVVAKTPLSSLSRKGIELTSLSVDKF